MGERGLGLGDGWIKPYLGSNYYIACVSVRNFTVCSLGRIAGSRACEHLDDGWIGKHKGETDETEINENWEYGALEISFGFFNAIRAPLAFAGLQLQVRYRMEKS